MTHESVSITLDDGIATLAIDRPQVMNALAASTIREMREALRGVREDTRARVLVITGQGRAFCTGADLNDAEIALDGPLAERPRLLDRLMAQEINPLMVEIQTFPKPTIAAVNGPAVGGGIGLALAADIAIAAESAYFMQVFTPRLGLVPDMGVTWHLERLVGRARARALALLGDRLPATTAAEWGLIWKTVPDPELSAEVMSAARRLADAPPLAVAALRKVLDEAPDNDFTTQLDFERIAQCGLVATQDAQEAILAFREKRPARFTGR